MIVGIVSALLLASLSLNAYFLYRLKKIKSRPDSYEARELLQDLVSGDALVRITRVAPANVILRSPRNV